MEYTLKMVNGEVAEIEDRKDEKKIEIENLIDMVRDRNMWKDDFLIKQTREREGSTIRRKGKIKKDNDLSRNLKNNKMVMDRLISRHKTKMKIRKKDMLKNEAINDLRFNMHLREP